jgi:hypothetical protein
MVPLKAGDDSRAAGTPRVSVRFDVEAGFDGEASKLLCILHHCGDGIGKTTRKLCGDG